MHLTKYTLKLGFLTLALGLEVLLSQCISPAMAAEAQAYAQMPTQTVFTQAVEAYRAKRYEAALEKLGVFESLEPDNPYLHYYRALSLDQLGRLPEAQAAYEHVVAATPSGAQVSEYAKARVKALQAQAALDKPPGLLSEATASYPVSSAPAAPSQTASTAPGQAGGQQMANATMQPAAQAAATPAIDPQMLLMMSLMGSGQGGMGGMGGGMGFNPALMGLMAGQGAGQLGQSGQNSGANAALINSMLMDQMMQQMDFGSGASSEDR
ncbi:MAG: hypothetical protein VKJ06_09145 [Vampirovibrionales bacterium]|nr:hypothetical protein [Vampirovibrionales bacterium]